MVETASRMALELALMFEKGDRYIQKEGIIQRWMADDQARDEFYESAKALGVGLDELTGYQLGVNKSLTD